MFGIQDIIETCQTALEQIPKEEKKDQQQRVVKKSRKRSLPYFLSY